MKREPFLALLVAVLMSACSSIDCPVKNTVRTYYSLKAPGAAVDTLKDTLSITSHRADGTDTVLLNRAISIVSFSLHVGYSNPEDTQGPLSPFRVGRLQCLVLPQYNCCPFDAARHRFYQNKQPISDL